MDHTVLIILTVTFGAIGFLTYGLCVYIGNRREMQERFAKSKTGIAPLVRRESKTSTLKEQILELISSFGKMALGKEKEKKETSDLRLILIQAGFRYTNSVAVFYGIKALSTMFLPLCYLLYMMWTSKVTTLNLGIALATAAVG